MKRSAKALDTTDLHILSCLFEDARITNKDLACKVGLAPSSCLERVKRLQQDGVIQRSSMQIDYTALNGHLQAMISVRIKNHSRSTVDYFQKQVVDLPEVINLFHMGGENDFLVHVTVSDTTHLRDFVLDAITAQEEVNHVETSLIYEHQMSHTLPQFD